MVLLTLPTLRAPRWRCRTAPSHAGAPPQHAGTSHPPAGQVEASGPGAAKEHLRQAYNAQLTCDMRN